MDRGGEFGYPSPLHTGGRKIVNRPGKGENRRVGREKSAEYGEKMKFMTRIAILLLFVGLAAASACAQAKPPLPEGQALKQQLLEADREFERRSAERGAEGWADSFAQDALIIQGSNRIQGRTAILESMKALLDDPQRGLTWTPDTAWASQSGDLGVTIGSFRSWRRSEEGEEQTVSSGTYITVWQRQEDGSWKVALDGGSPDPQPERVDQQ